MPHIGTDPATARVWATTESSSELWHVYGPDGHALCNRRIRPRGHYNGSTNFFTMAKAETFPLSHLHDRCRDKLNAAAAAKREAQRDREQYTLAADLFAALHPAADQAVESHRGNVIDTIHEGGPYAGPEQVWEYIGYEPAAWLPHDDWATADGFNKAWADLDSRARAGSLTRHHWDLALDRIRNILAAHPAPAPESPDESPAPRQVLYFVESPLTGEQAYDFPLHSVIRTDWLRRGRSWDTVDAELATQGLARYGFLQDESESAEHALSLARARWEEEGPYAGLWDVIRPELNAEDDLPRVTA
ncbi:hypothetical protein ACIQ9R_36145 [Streptomyces sp. NPDC094447]|uniref:hypothetical protein n=1 Tax=Streptomyces sp. NPDC094447 TaxID=3366062 RepID=UPI0038295CE4